MTDAERVARLSRPHTYAQDRLGLTLHPKQAQVLKRLFIRGAREVFRCSNEVGKTTHVATAAILYAIEILKAQVISTAGVWMQVAQQLIPALKGHAHRFPTWQFNDTTIVDAGGIDRYVGFSTRNEGFAQGFHRKDGMPLLAIVDEAAAVEDNIIDSIEDRCNPDYFLLMGSPLDPIGRLYDAETKMAPLYGHTTLNQLECLKDNPPAEAELRELLKDTRFKVPDGLKTGWLDPAGIVRKIKKHGVGNPFLLSNVFGEFSDLVEGALLSLGEYEACVNNPPALAGTDRHAMFDFAAGRAKNVFACRTGNRVFIAKKWTERDTMAAVGQFVLTQKKLQREIGLTPEECEGDGDGLGKPMVDRLREVGLQIGDFRGGGPPQFDDDYADAWSEAWGETAAKIKKKELILPDDPDFKAQILSRKIKPNSSGKLKIEPKDQMEGESPDEADAVCRACMPLPMGRRVVAGGDAPPSNTKDDMWGSDPWANQPEEEHTIPGTHFG